MGSPETMKIERELIGELVRDEYVACVYIVKLPLGWCTQTQGEDAWGIPVLRKSKADARKAACRILAAMRAEDNPGQKPST